jgi:transposase
LSGIRNRIRARKSERTRLHSWAFGQLQSFVLYKAKRAGVPVVFVDPRNTSRKCAVCDTVSKANRKTQAAFECIACGHTNNADANAAENIRRAAVNLPNATSVVSATRMSHLVVSGSELDWKS